MIKTKRRLNIELIILLLGILIFTVACKNNGIQIKDDDSSTLPPNITSNEEETTVSAIESETDTQTQPPETVTEPLILTTETTTAATETAPEMQTPILSGTTENKLTLTAESLIGIMFAEGGSSPDTGFDNSGFIYYVLKQNGYVNCPRGLSEQSVMGTKIEKMNELLSGDLVFFSENGTNAQFGGIYKGDGIMISCPQPGQPVKETDITVNYYVNNFFTGVRVI